MQGAFGQGVQLAFAAARTDPRPPRRRRRRRLRCHRCARGGQLGWHVCRGGRPPRRSAAAGGGVHDDDPGAHRSPGAHVGLARAADVASRPGRHQRAPVVRPSSTRAPLSSPSLCRPPSSLPPWGERGLRCVFALPRLNARMMPGRQVQAVQQHLRGATEPGRAGALRFCAPVPDRLRARYQAGPDAGARGGPGHPHRHRGRRVRVPAPDGRAGPSRGGGEGSGRW